jgi:hypothetical protein
VNPPLNVVNSVQGEVVKDPGVEGFASQSLTVEIANLRTVAKPTSTGSVKVHQMSLKEPDYTNRPRRSCLFSFHGEILLYRHTTAGSLFDVQLSKHLFLTVLRTYDGGGPLSFGPRGLTDRDIRAE